MQLLGCRPIFIANVYRLKGAQYSLPEQSAPQIRKLRESREVHHESRLGSNKHSYSDRNRLFRNRSDREASRSS
jgi:hypothetical protein